MPSSTSRTDERESIRAIALAEGFDVARFAKAVSPGASAKRLREYLELGRHGDMRWMAANAERRADPLMLWPEARSVLVVGLNYGPARDPRAILSEPGRGGISAYAQGDDYHEVMKKKLRRIAAFVAEKYAAEVKLFVDTAPVMEKPIAEAAGLGWQGKHTNLVSRDYGSWLFLGSVFMTLDLEPDAGDDDRCGECRRCLDVCPTDAFPAPYQLDARRCISYLTIEHKGHIAREFRKPMGNRIYGCDDCLAVCPWNKFASASREMRLSARAELERPRLGDLAQLSDAQFRDLFRGSPVKRVGRDRFVRNVLVAIGNSKDSALASVAHDLLADESPLVRAMAVWALSQLLPSADFVALKASHVPHENDPAVRDEWASS